MTGWTYRETPEDLDMAYAVEGGCPVADVYGSDIAGVSRREVESRARLIAAAPDLLEALFAVDTARMTDLPKDWTRATKLTDAAIAKATGEASA